MVRKIISYMWANPFQGPLEGVGPENLDFFGPWMATSEASAIWAPIKIMKSKASYKKTGTLVILCTCVWFIFCILYSVFCSVCCEFYVHVNGPCSYPRDIRPLSAFSWPKPNNLVDFRSSFKVRISVKKLCIPYTQMKKKRCAF